MTGFYQPVSGVTVSANVAEFVSPGAIRKGSRELPLGFFDRDQGIAVLTSLGNGTADSFSPRHRHFFDQIRFFVAGHKRYGDKVYGEGDCIYLPESVRYGPMSAPEGATESERECTFYALQFQGPSRIPYIHPDDRRAATRALSEVGEFVDGIYIDANGRRRDGYEAMVEHVFGTLPEYSASRYSDIVVTRSAAFPWVETAHEGVAVKQLGSFTEYGPVVRLLQFGAGAELPEVATQRTEVRCLLEGDLLVGDSQVEFPAAAYLPKGAPSGRFASENGATVLSVQLFIEDELPTIV